jgi:two-component system OmpR family sensor kinase
LLPQQRSLRTNFLIKLIAAMAVLELFFSAVFYSYIRYSVDHELEEAIVKQGRYLFATYDDVAKVLADKKEILQRTMKVHARIVALPNENFRSIHFRKFKQDHRYYLEAFFPYEFALQRYLVLTADITKQKRVQNQVTRGIILMNIFGMVGILLYAFFLSNMLIAPIRVFSQKLTKMNERALSPLILKGMPEEFVPLGESINHLIGRIQSFLNYKKELFVGTAHELKTPLAVIKTKSQVTLLKKKKTTEDLLEALKQNIRSVDDMNKIIGSILEFGRAEGAQFEEPETIDLIAFLRTMCDEFSLLASRDQKILRCKFTPDTLKIMLPPLLLRQIVQNLLQNAIKFTPEGKTIKFLSYRDKNNYVIKVRDEGRGVDDEEDLFAPFKRSPDSTGAGLGLFLVKSASDALRAEISIKNRRDGKGAVATLILPLGRQSFK